MFRNLEIFLRGGVECDGLTDMDRIPTPGATDCHLADAVEAIIHRPNIIERHLHDVWFAKRNTPPCTLGLVTTLCGRITLWVQALQPELEIIPTHMTPPKT